MPEEWLTAPQPAAPRRDLWAWLRIARRGLALGVVVFGGLLVLLLIRLVEKPVHGVARPWTPWITQGVCRAAFAILGMGHSTQGTRMTQAGAVVANHGSWLDIFALNARKRVYFVSKDEVAGWPGIGWLAKATGTVFITRAAREAKAQKALFEERLGAGHKLLFFPEGTSSDSRRILPFKSTLFAAFFTESLREMMFVQPATVLYTAPTGADPRFYGWWGDSDFASHLLAVLATPAQGAVEVIYHEPLRVADFPDRKALSRACEAVVREAFEARVS